MTDEARQYILELFSMVSTESLLVVTRAGQLKKLNCPFFVVCRITTTHLVKGGEYAVDSVKMTLKLEDVFIIDGRAYHVWYFTIID